MKSKNYTTKRASEKQQKINNRTAFEQDNHIGRYKTKGEKMETRESLYKFVIAIAEDIKKQVDLYDISSELQEASETAEELGNEEAK